MTRLSRTDPTLAVTAAIETTVKLNDVGSVFSFLAAPPRADITRTLARLLREFPETVQPSVPLDHAPTGLYGIRAVPLIKRPGFVFSGAALNEGELVYLSPPERRRLALPAPASGDDPPIILGLQEVDRDVILFSRDDVGIVVIHHGVALGTYHVDSFRGKPAVPDQTSSLLVTGRIVALLTEERVAASDNIPPRASMTVEAFEFDAARASGNPFVARGVTAVMRDSPGRQYFLVDGVLMEITYNLPTDEKGPGRPEFKGLAGRDLATGKVWSLAPDGPSILSSCIRPGAGGCRGIVWQAGDNSAAISMLRWLNAPTPPATGASPPAAATAASPRGEDRLVLVDPHSGRMHDLNVHQLNELRGRTVADGPDRSPRAAPGIENATEEFAIGGTIDDAVLVVPDGPVIDVFRVRRGQPAFLGTFRAPGRIGRIAVSHDGTMVLAVSDTFDGFWKVADLETTPPLPLLADLIETACRKKLVVKAPDRAQWIIATGLTTPPTSDRCPQLPEPKQPL